MNLLVLVLFGLYDAIGAMPINVICILFELYAGKSLPQVLNDLGTSFYNNTFLINVLNLKMAKIICNQTTDFNSMNRWQLP